LSGAEKGRYGFNGMEIDNEIKNGDGNSYDFGARMLDPRLGRWLTLDPLSGKYPDASPYLAMNNNPIVYIDPNGKNGIASIVGDKVVVTQNYYFYGSGIDNAKASEIAKGIEDAWNSANGKVTIDGKEYAVEFKVSAQAIEGPEKAAEMLQTAAFEDNFVAIGDDKSRYPENVSDKTRAGKLINTSRTHGKSAWWNNAQDEEFAGTTFSHEPSHGLGMSGHPDVNSDGTLKTTVGTMDENGNFAIRLPSNTIQDGKEIDSKKRIVMQSDIDMLHIAEAIKNNNGQLQPEKFKGAGVSVFNADGSTFKTLESTAVSGNGTAVETAPTPTGQ